MPHGRPYGTVRCRICGMNSGESLRKRHPRRDRCRVEGTWAEGDAAFRAEDWSGAAPGDHGKTNPANPRMSGMRNEVILCARDLTRTRQTSWQDSAPISDQPGRHHRSPARTPDSHAGIAGDARRATSTTLAGRLPPPLCLPGQSPPDCGLRLQSREIAGLVRPPER